MRLGIDFGTTNSAAAVFDGQNLHPIHIYSPQQSQILPSLIYIDREHSAQLGLSAAAEYAHRETGRAVRWRSRLMGEVQMWVATGGSPILVRQEVLVTYDEAAFGRLLQSIKTALRNERYGGTQIFDRYYTLDELIALVLKTLKDSAEAQLGKSCDEVVIGRPVKFSEKRWVSNRAEEIIYKAARLAGFKAISFQAEPIGALYVYHVAAQQRETVLVFDFGGGTLDLTVAEVGAGKAPRVLATRGVLVGGDDLDRRIMISLFKYFGEDSKRDLQLPHEFLDLLSNWQSMPELSRPHHEDTLRTLRRSSKHPETIDALRTLVSKNLGYSLFSEIERVKKELSSNLAATLKFQHDNIRIFERITRSQFEAMIKHEIKAVREGISDVLAEAEMTPNQINRVLRTGGSSLVPAFVKMLSEFFGAEKLHEMDPLVSVVGGLGIVAHENSGLWGDYRARYVDRPEDAIAGIENQGSFAYQPYMLRIGERCYVDHETHIRKMPVEISGLPAIRTAYADRENAAEDFLHLNLPCPSRVYVAYTTRAVVRPDWLKTFELMDEMTIEIKDEWYGVRQMQLYSRTFAPGEVILGGNNAAGVEGKLDATYLVVVDPGA